MFQLAPHLLPADNPQQSETSSHIGVGGNFNCRRDLMGGSEAEKETPGVYKSLHAPGPPRSSEQTIQCIQYQIWLACFGNLGAVEESWTDTGIKDKISVYWIGRILDKAKVIHETRIKNVTTRAPELNDKAIKNEARKAIILQLTRKIQMELWDWVIQQPESSYVNLAEDDRESKTFKRLRCSDLLLNF